MIERLPVTGSNAAEHVNGKVRADPDVTARQLKGNYRCYAVPRRKGERSSMDHSAIRIENVDGHVRLDRKQFVGIHDCVSGEV